MQSERPSSNINRRVLISGMALLPAWSAIPLSGIAQAQTTQGSPLASWNDGPAKQAIIDFVRATTEQGSP
ncbi:MAG: haloacid dehalogenase-like hydrolase, partial [Pseudolabrys sp.]